MRFFNLGAGLALSALLATSAVAQAPVKIGFITTLSGPAGYIGADARDAFNLAVEMEGGKLGGVPVQAKLGHGPPSSWSSIGVACGFLAISRVSFKAAPMLA